MAGKLINKKLKKLLDILNRLHSYHGFTILDTTSKSKLRRFYEISILILTILNVSSVVVASTEKYGSKRKLERTMFKILSFTATYLFICELMYWSRKNEILELVNWCHWAENYKPSPRSGLKKPKDWFGGKRKMIRLIIRWDTIYWNKNSRGGSQNFWS